MEPNEDEQNVDPPVPPESGQDAASEGGVVTPDTALGSDPATESRRTDEEVGPTEEESSSGDFDNSEEIATPEETASSSAAATTQSDEPLTQIELSAEPGSLVTAPLAMQRDQHNYLLPLDSDGTSAGDSKPADRIFPPEWRLPAESSTSLRTGQTTTPDPKYESLGHTIPRVQILVSLVEARVMYAAAMEEALETYEPKYRQIAESEVERGFGRYEVERRAVEGW